MTPRRLILENWQSPGDIVMLTAAVRDLHLTHPGQFETDVRTPCPALWEHNPYLTTIPDDDPTAERIQCEYPLIHRSNDAPYHFIHGFRLFLEERLGVRIEPHAFRGDIHIADEERGWFSQVQEITGEDTPFWVVVSGGKMDFTAKWPDPDTLQSVIDHFKGKIQFVQVGEASHHHPRLNGVIDLIGKTDLRQAVRLCYHAAGILCPVTLWMHLAAAVPTQAGRAPLRPCVVLAGGREPSHWERYPGHAYLDTIGRFGLDCCSAGGCWKSRVARIGDGDLKDTDLCHKPVRTHAGHMMPMCQSMIRDSDVIRAIEGFWTAATGL